MKKVQAFMFASGAAIALAIAGAAQGAYDNFAPGFVYGSSPHTNFQSLAMGFTAETSGNVTDIYFAANVGPAPATVQLWAASDDWTMDALLGQWTTGTGNALHHIAVDGGPAIFETGQYWLQIVPNPQSEGQLAWWQNVTGATGPMAIGGNIVNLDATLGAFAVIVPGPGALAMMALAGIGTTRRRRR